MNCIFLHHVSPSTEKSPGVAQKSSVPRKGRASVAQTAMESRDDTPRDDRPRKKRRIDNNETDEANDFVGFQSQSSVSKPSGSPSHHFLTRERLQASRAERSLLSGNPSTDGKFALPGKETIKQASDSTRQVSGRDKSTAILKRKRKDPQQNDLSPVRSMSKNSSEAVTQPQRYSVPQVSQEDIKESLNPRMVPNPPASHSIRIKLLALLHQYITKLNDQIKLSDNPSEASLVLSPQQLTTEALNIESSIAIESPFVYENIMKKRIMKYKRMNLRDWTIERTANRSQTTTVPPAEPVSAPGKIETGLSSTDELAFLPRLYADQAMLSKFEYVTSAPTQQEVDAAVEGVEAAQHWEVCDRCSTRFQIFEGRRQKDGFSTTGGRCFWHDRKYTYRSYDNEEEVHSCCYKPQGTMGCQNIGCHVFKVTDPKRLAASMPFLETPENPAPLCKEAVAFDCEMGYTSLGMELIRLTAISWPTGAPLIDVLVRPLGHILDLNSKFSGVSHQQHGRGTMNVVQGLANHEPKTIDGEKILKMMNTPMEARALLFKYISPTTPLIGHALENDLKVMRIIHPCIVDTVDVYPHSRKLPHRNSLKWLAVEVLGRYIQRSSDGHDADEDARTAGDLVKAKIRNVVNIWRGNGYKFGDPLRASDWNLKTPLR